MLQTVIEIPLEC